MQVLLECQCVGALLQASLPVCAMREVDALKPALAFLAHCVKLPVADTAAAEVRPATGPLRRVCACCVTYQQAWLSALALLLHCVELPRADTAAAVLGLEAVSALPLATTCSCQPLNSFIQPRSTSPFMAHHAIGDDGALQGLRGMLHAFLQQQGPQLASALLRAAADSCPTQLLRPLALLLHALLGSGPLQPARHQLLGHALADPAFPGAKSADVLRNLRELALICGLLADPLSTLRGCRADSARPAWHLIMDSMTRRQS